MSEYFLLYEYVEGRNKIYITCYINEMKEYLLGLTNKTKSITQIISAISEEEQNKINDLKKNTTLSQIQIAFMKYVVKVWLDNMTSDVKTELTCIDMYFAFYDVKLYYDINFDYTWHDGDKSCDISTNLILFHVLIKHFLILLSEYNTQFKEACFKVLKNFRVGIYKYNDYTSTFEDLVILHHHEDIKVYIFYIKHREYDVTFYMKNSSSINTECRLYLPWIVDKVYNVLIFLQEAVNFTFIPTVLNQMERSNLFEKVENDFAEQMLRFKLFKDILYSISLNTNTCEDEVVSKRVKTKERKIRHEP